MFYDISSLIFGTICSALVAQVTHEIGFPSYLTSLTASGVLAVVFYYVLYRYEKRIDAAFKAHGELEERLFNLLKTYMKPENEDKK